MIHYFTNVLIKPFQSATKQQQHYSKSIYKSTCIHLRIVYYIMCMVACLNHIQNIKKTLLLSEPNAKYIKKYTLCLAGSVLSSASGG